MTISRTISIPVPRGPLLYRWAIRPALWLLPPETAHHLALVMLRLATWTGLTAPLRRLCAPTERALRVQALGREFSTPIGLAAGFDKDAVAFEGLGALGFGFVEVGTVTAQRQPGNARPRLFRLPADQALVNRLGFNNRGAATVARRLRRTARSRRTVVGVNIGKTKAIPEQHGIEDYVRSTEQLAPYADYLVVNVSSPNTPGLRALQAVRPLRPLLQSVREAVDRVVPERHVPLLVKIAPDLADEDIDAVADLALELQLDGIVATNTTVTREALYSDPEEVRACGSGGLSGHPLKYRALEVLRRLRARTGNQLTLVAVGGVETAEDAWARIRAGATLVQVYTALVYQGPSLPRDMGRGLVRLARNAGYARVQDAVGADVDQLASPPEAALSQ